MPQYLLAEVDADDKQRGNTRSEFIRGFADLAVQHEISVYDATYAAAAIDSGSRLISCDHRNLIDDGLAAPPG